MELRLVGQVDYSVIKTYRKYGIEGRVKLVGSVSRKEALNKMSASVLLLLLLNQQANAKGRMPGKLFEYLAVRRPYSIFRPNKRRCSSSYH